MCFILSTTNLQNEHLDRLELEWASNPDGAGFARHNGKTLLCKRGYWTFKSLRKALNKELGSKAIIHLRHATHGVVSVENCHPFEVAEGSAYMAHNGILPAPFSSNRDISDTGALAMLLQGVSWEQLKRDRKEIGDTIGYNKLAMLHVSGELLIVNHEYGEWLKKGETWVSRKEYKKATIQHPLIAWRKGSTTVDGVTHFWEGEHGDEYYKDLSIQTNNYLNNLSK